jgi:thiamine-monophosphate kinase
VTARDPPALSGEDRLIAQYFRPLARHPGAMELRDDAAFYTPPDGCDLVLTKDAIVAGVHFFADDPADAVGRKALRVNLSDLAAKGAVPQGFLLALALPSDIGDAWLEGFARALGADADQYGCPLFGGDTVSTPGPLTVSITAFGTLPRGTMVHRSGAGVGDRVFVTGTVGDGALGLRLRRDPAKAAQWSLDAAARDHLVERYRTPQPRTALAEAVRRHASAAMDVSDGLAGDLGKLCRESGVTAEIEVARVPLSAPAGAALAADPALIEAMLTGGDDYEIVCTVRPERIDAFRAEAAAAGVPIADIGGVVAGEGPPRFADRSGHVLAFARGAFSHF